MTLRYLKPPDVHDQYGFLGLDVDTDNKKW